jgi:hypothetical protein
MAKSKRPKGRRYRNLFRRGDAGGTIYFERRVQGKLIRASTEMQKWDDAAAVRDLLEKKLAIAADQAGEPALEVAPSPTLAEFAPRYLAEDAHHLSPNTLHDRKALRAESEDKRAGRLLDTLAAAA